ncbi:MAG: peptide deformylase [candidate division Zixibacteria bacterium]|nr:peptide deformylase [candidate division Zixibacteria bacterium]
MAVRPIVIYGDPVLREVSKPVGTIDRRIQDLVSDMSDTLRKARGLGLAAVQIGVPMRVFIVDLGAVDIKETLRVFINPEILETTDEIEYEEGCLSFPDIFQKITRPAYVRVRATNLEGKVFEMSAEGMIARAILHEYDHLEGTLFIDRISPFAMTMLRSKLKRLATAS